MCGTTSNPFASRKSKWESLFTDLSCGSISSNAKNSSLRCFESVESSFLTLPAARPLGCEYAEAMLLLISSKFFQEMTPSPLTSNACLSSTVRGTLRKFFPVCVTSSPMMPSVPRVIACPRCPLSYLSTSVRPSSFQDKNTSLLSAKATSASADFVLSAESIGFVWRTGVSSFNISPGTLFVGELDKTTPVSFSNAFSFSTMMS